MALMAFIFACVALAYASVGFAGGSTYTALLVLSGVAFPLLKAVSLSCNILVSLGNAVHFTRKGLYDWRNDGVMIGVSVPAAFAGGATPLSQETFIILLGLFLLFASFSVGASAYLDITKQRHLAETLTGDQPRWMALTAGCLVGFASGLVGIGGGIILAPILHMLKWASARRIAALSSLYIVANSIAGLCGLTLSQSTTGALTGVVNFWPLALSVIVGGFVGRRAAASWLPQHIIKAATALLIFIVSCRLLWTSWSQVIA